MNKKQLIGVLVAGSKQRNDSIFDCPASQDGRNQLYADLRSELLRQGISLHTPDVCNRLQMRPDFEIHVNVRRRIKSHTARRYLLLLETPLIRPLNSREDLIDGYDAIFTWRQDWLHKPRHFEIAAYPVPINVSFERPSKRDKLVCLIAANKASRANDARELYSTRLQTIRWFESHHAEEFDLFGGGWDKPAATNTLLTKIKATASHWFRHPVAPHFPSWRGATESKAVTLAQYAFSICYENTRGMPGYITEKIFDSMTAGCIPVYLGDPGIKRHIPRTCYLARDDYASHEALYEIMRGMSQDELLARQRAMREFVSSERAQGFSSKTFGINVCEQIVKDISANGHN